MTTFVFMNGKKEIVRLPEVDLVKLAGNMDEIIRATEALFDQEITTIKIVESEEK